MDTSKVNLLGLVDKDTLLKKVAGTNGGEYHGPCPFCGGKDRFVVQPLNRLGAGRWMCRKCSPRWQDSIAYARKRYGYSFKEACEYLSLVSFIFYNRDPAETFAGRLEMAEPLPYPRRDYPSVTDVTWRDAAWQFVQECVFNLYNTPAGVDLWHDFLLEQRRLTADVISCAKLGYNPQDRRMLWGSTEVWLPRGLVFPWFNGLAPEKLQKVTVRRMDGKNPRYIQAAGSANINYFMARRYSERPNVIMVEGELDALALISALGEMVRFFSVTATGSAMGARHTHTLTSFGRGGNIYLAFDADVAGDSAAEFWTGKSPIRKWIRLRPTRKDPGEMVAAGDDILAWINAAEPYAHINLLNVVTE